MSSRLRSALFTALWLALFAWPGCGWSRGSAQSPKSVTVLAAASLTNALQEVADAWSAQSGQHVQISFGPSNALAQQILAGAPADIYLSANEQWAASLAKQDFVEQQVVLLSNRLVWIIPKDNRAGIIDASEIVTKAKQIALAGENVPAGIYADQSLHSTGMYDLLVDRIVRGNDVRTTLAYVEQGEVDAGIVYATDAAVTARVSVLGELDPTSYSPILYPAILLKDASPAAAGFFTFLQSAEGSKIFARHRFISLPARAGEMNDAGRP